MTDKKESGIKEFYGYVYTIAKSNGQADAYNETTKSNGEYFGKTFGMR